MKRSQGGLTLIELLVAVTIFALLGAMSYRALDQAVSSQQRLEAEFADWRELARTLGRIEGDLQQMGSRHGLTVARPTGVEEKPPALRMQMSDDNAERIFFWRLDSRQGARLIGFEFHEGKLDQLQWPQDDLTQEPRRNTLLAGVRTVEWAFLRRGVPNWIAQWPPEPNANDEVPSGIRISLDTERFGRISRTFSLR